MCEGDVNRFKEHFSFCRWPGRRTLFIFYEKGNKPNVSEQRADRPPRHCLRASTTTTTSTANFAHFNNFRYPTITYRSFMVGLYRDMQMSKRYLLPRTNGIERNLSLLNRVKNSEYLINLREFRVKSDVDCWRSWDLITSI